MFLLSHLLCKNAKHVLFMTSEMWRFTAFSDLDQCKAIIFGFWTVGQLEQTTSIGILGNILNSNQLINYSNK